MAAVASCSKSSGAAIFAVANAHAMLEMSCALNSSIFEMASLANASNSGFCACREDANAHAVMDISRGAKVAILETDVSARE